MIYKMRLHEAPFDLIKSGIKTIEIRLNDEKRQLLKENDIIEFENRTTGDKIKTKIIYLHKFNNFFELYQKFDKVSLGYRADEDADYRDMEKYYSIEEQEKYGVVGIEISLL